MNEFLFFITIIESFALSLVFYKLFGKAGLYAWIGIATIITNLEVAKCVDMFGLSLTLGNVIYGSVFLCTDILSEVYGGKEARRGVLIGFVSMLVFVVMTQTALWFEPNSQDFINESMKQLFSLMPRLCIASMLTYLVSNNLDTFTYDWIRKKFPKHLWLRNNGSTITSQLVDTVMFSILAFAGLYDVKTIIEISITSYIIKIVISLCDTPFLYVARKIRSSGRDVEVL